MIKERKKVSLVILITNIVLLLVLIWDVLALQSHYKFLFWPVKISIISSLFLLISLNEKKVLKPNIIFNIFFSIYIFYCTWGTIFFDATYFFAFLEGFVFFIFLYFGNFRDYFILSFLAFISMCVSIYLMPEPSFVKEGISLKPHLYIVGLIFFAVSIAFSYFLKRQRLMVDQATDQFANLGQQAALLLHELKSPLSRFSRSLSEFNKNDAEHVMSIIQSIEMLLSTPDHFKSSFHPFKWKELEEYLSHEFKDFLEGYKINFEFKDLDGDGYGHLPTLKLAIRNLVKNALESIVAHTAQGSIIIELKPDQVGQSLLVKNNGGPISHSNIKKLFDPLYSTKTNTKQNFGMGLYFVKNVIQTHGGNIKVSQQDSWCVFEINLPGKVQA